MATTYYKHVISEGSDFDDDVVVIKDDDTDTHIYYANLTSSIASRAIRSDSNVTEIGGLSTSTPVQQEIDDAEALWAATTYMV